MQTFLRAVYTASEWPIAGKSCAAHATALGSNKNTHDADDQRNVVPFLRNLPKLKCKVLRRGFVWWKGWWKEKQRWKHRWQRSFTEIAL